MKRFIKEYANYKIKDYTENNLMNQDIREMLITKINNVVRQEEKGLITVDEAMGLISGYLK